jgi:hypothetical protein
MQPQPEMFFHRYNLPMPRVGEFCPSNVARLLLGVVIVVALVAAVGVWLFYSPGRGNSIEQPAKTAQPNR